MERVVKMAGMLLVGLIVERVVKMIGMLLEELIVPLGRLRVDLPLGTVVGWLEAGSE